MALTTAETNWVKEQVAQKEKEATIKAINDKAYADKQVLLQQVQDIENQRLKDIAEL